MEMVHKAEKALERLFSSAPSLSKDAKKSLASIWPWLVLVGGVFQLWGAWQLYRWADSWNKVAEWANTWARSLGVDSRTSGLTVWVWISIVVLAITAVLLLLAFPKLQKKEKSGWDLAFLAALINLAYGVLNLFIDGRGFGYLLGSLIGSAIGFYLLFQIREHFGGRAIASTVRSSSSDDKKSE